MVVLSCPSDPRPINLIDVLNIAQWARKVEKLTYLSRHGTMREPCDLTEVRSFGDCNSGITRYNVNCLSALLNRRHGPVVEAMGSPPHKMCMTPYHRLGPR